MKYRKRPVVIEAIQWDGTWEDSANILEFCQGNAFVRNDLDFKRQYLIIKTLEGEHLVSPKDFVIKGIAGEFYPCKSDIFEKTYEKVDD